LLSVGDHTTQLLLKQQAQLLQVLYLFKTTADALIKHLEKMFREDKLKDLENMIMVGGFSECEIMQHKIKEKFGKDKKIIIPEEAGLAVLLNQSISCSFE
jgi:activator of 2-hydroxyglutaryl-CoA dehydratase